MNLLDKNWGPSHSLHEGETDGHALVQIYEKLFLGSLKHDLTEI